MKNLFLNKRCLSDRGVIIEGENYHYIRNVRRMQKGDRLHAIIDKKRYLLVVTHIAENRIECSIEESKELRSRDGVKISVYQGVLKARKMDIVISKLGEMGIATFYPIITERTVPRGDFEMKMHRWMMLAQEGAKVSGFEEIMRIAIPAPLPTALKSLKNAENTVIIIFSTEYFRFHLRSYLESIHSARNMDFHLFFGPEGGFSEEEVELLVKQGGVPVTMGPFILKSETASIIGSGFIRLFYS